jgi:hypothetical protein
MNGLSREQALELAERLWCGCVEGIADELLSVRREALEEAARVADAQNNRCTERYTCHDIASAIRRIAQPAAQEPK